jgi:lysophospholipid acyltransferase 5
LVLIFHEIILLSTCSYAGKYEDGTANWTGCANVKLRRLESAAQFGHYIAAFNINTNGWVASYVYKVLPLPPSETTF